MGGVKTTVSMKLILFSIVLMLGIMPLILMQTIVTRSVQQNILRNSTILTQGIMEQSQLYLNRLFSDLASYVSHLSEIPEIISILEEKGPGALTLEVLEEHKHGDLILGNIAFISRDETFESYLFDITYNRKIPIASKAAYLFSESNEGQDLISNDDRLLWRGQSPFGLSGAEVSMWIYSKLPTGTSEFFVASSISRLELIEMLTSISSTSRSEVFLVSSDRKIFPESVDFFQYDFAEKILSQSIEGRFNILYETRYTAKGTEKIMIQIYSDPEYFYKLITITPEKNLIRGFDTIVSTTTTSLIVLSLISILIGSIFIFLFTRQIQILIKALHEIGAGQYDINLGSGNLQITESAILSSSISDLAEEVKSSRLNLEQKVEERTEELRTSLEQLHMTRQSLIHSEQMAIMGRQGAKIAHEINNPISVAITASTHLESSAKDIKRKFDDSKLTKKDFNDLMNLSLEVSDLIHRNLRQATSMIMGFKDFASDQSRGEKKTLRIASYVNEIIKSFSYKMKKTPFEIEFQCDENLEIETIPSIIYQAITNLINNSLLHGFEGLDSGLINIEITKKKDHLLLLYSDDGKGISPENLKQLYKPFFTTKAGEGGTGLGLNIIKDLIEGELGGTIDCDSEMGKGVRFSITIPLNGAS